MSNETIDLAVETADLSNGSENTALPEISKGENIADAVRNAVRELGLGTTIGLTAFAVIVPFVGIPGAVAAAALLSKGKRTR